jgi:hypothetical protein
VLVLVEVEMGDVGTDPDVVEVAVVVGAGGVVVGPWV